MKIRNIAFRSVLEDDEKILRVFRQFFPAPKVLFHLIFWGGIAGGLAWFFAGTEYQISAAVPAIFGAYRIGVVFLRWYKNAVLMTDQALVFVEWKKPFWQKITRLDYWDLDEVSLERTSAREFFSGVGDLVFERVNGGESLIFEQARRPKRTIKIIHKHRERMLDEKNFTEESALKNLLSQMVQGHVRQDGQPQRSGEKSAPASKNLEKKSSKKVAPVVEIEDSVEVDFELDEEGGISLEL